MARVVLCPAVDAVLGEGGLRLHPTDGRQAVAIDGAVGRELGSVLARGDVTIGEHDGVLLELLEALLESGYLRPAAQVHAPDVARWDRQVRYLSREGRSGPAAQRQLRSAHVAIFGVGGVGGAVADALARMGVGVLSFIDHDVVELANIARQPLFDETSVGQHKVVAAAARVRQLDATLDVSTRAERVTSADHARQLLAGLRPDFVVIAADDPPELTQARIGAACADLGLPCMIAGHRPPRLRIGPLLVPGTTACMECHQRTEGRDDSLTRVAAAIPGVLPGDQVAGSWMAFTIASWITGSGADAFLDRALEIDLVSGAQQWSQPPAQRCVSCLPGARRAA